MTTKPEIKDESGDNYKFGFITDIDTEIVPKGLNEDIIKLISQKKEEPEWLLESRLKAFRKWQTMTEPTWAKVSYDKIDYQDLYYYSAPKQKVSPKSLDEVDPKILETYNKLGIPLKEQEVLAGVVAVDAVFDSVSVATTYKAELKKQGKIKYYSGKQSKCQAQAAFISAGILLFGQPGQEISPAAPEKHRPAPFFPHHRRIGRYS